MFDGVETVLHDQQDDLEVLQAEAGALVAKALATLDARKLLAMSGAERAEAIYQALAQVYAAGVVKYQRRARGLGAKLAREMLA